jgi:hypothetical protein
MPAGAVCGCGRLTRRPSKKCESCERGAAHDRSLRVAVYQDDRWRRTKRTVWARDDWTCKLCGKRDPQNAGRTLDCHHRRGVLELLALDLDPFDPDECETRCKRCHAGDHHRNR